MSERCIECGGSGWVTPPMDRSEQDGDVRCRVCDGCGQVNSTPSPAAPCPDRCETVHDTCEQGRRTLQAARAADPVHAAAFAALNEHYKPWFVEEIRGPVHVAVAAAVAEERATTGRRIEELETFERMMRCAVDEPEGWRVHTLLGWINTQLAALASPGEGE